MLNEVQKLLPESARFEARVSDLEDIEELVRVHRPSVLRHAWWLLKDKDLAETVTQDCFMRAFNSRALYRGQCSVRTWLMANLWLSILETSALVGRGRVRHGKPATLPPANRGG
jgi:DNA-directed RNA polymerase specialized sigma24 family protein